MKSLLKALLSLLFCAFALPPEAAGNASAAKEEFVVILDPGHGGKDCGAVGAITNEKTINLNVGKAVRDLLKDRKGLKTVMTRSDDRFIELQERANIANRNHGDLFVSIHVNSLAKSNKKRKSIHGASVYVLGLHRTESNLEVAKRENSVMELEADYSAKYQGFDPSSTESYIMFELSQNEHLDRSIRFAELTENNLCEKAGRGNRGVLQAGFWVLHASAMPAVLIELDFICNPEAEKFLASDAGVNKMARAIADAILDYSGRTALPDKVEQPHPDPCPEETAPAEAMTDSHAVSYRVQFMAIDRTLPAGSAEFKGLDKVEEYQQNGMHKFTAGGDFVSEAEAEAYARRHVRKLFPEAFIIKWQDGHRIQ